MNRIRNRVHTHRVLEELCNRLTASYRPIRHRKELIGLYVLAELIRFIFSLHVENVEKEQAY